MGGRPGLTVNLNRGYRLLAIGCSLAVRGWEGPQSLRPLTGATQAGRGWLPGLGATELSCHLAHTLFWFFN